MTEVDRSRRIQASLDDVWSVAGSPSRLADWVPTARLAQRADAEDVHLEGESHGHPYAVTSPFHADEATHRLEWSAPDASGYAGSLQLRDDAGATEVHLHLSIPDDKLPPSEAVITEIERGADEALDRLSELVVS